ncbi:MAG TPA: hypothetical protein VJ725_20945 [Thermoanaerobaculia bacterium]|nr:hypothetical protein [Thermoanaerobaculia bacterium]
MDLLLFLAAAALLLTAGFGAAAPALSGRERVSLGEVVALSVLLGALFVTLAWWGLSLLLPGPRAVQGVALLAFVLGSAGVLAWARRRPRIEGVGLFCALALPLTAAVVWIAATTCFEWDGLFIWEVKAQSIAAAQGGPPWDYFHDDSRAWSHPVYPLLVPFFRAWFYVWVGEPHEAYGSVAGALFVLAAAGLFASLAPRLGTAATLVAFALFTFTPLEILGSGSATSGYADFPLAVYYLGALVYLFHAVGSPRPGDLAIAGWLAAALPWVKQEGTILWACLLALALVALRGPGWRGLLRLAAPGVGVLLAWRAFVAVVRVETAPVFYPVSLGLFRERLHLWDEIGGEMAKRALDPGNWGLLWVLFPLAALLGIRLLRSRRLLLLAGAVVAPLPVFSLPYFFTRWEPVTLHVHSSFTRLLLPLSLPAIVLIAWATAALAFPASRESE